MKRFKQKNLKIEDHQTLFKESQYDDLEQRLSKK